LRGKKRRKENFRKKKEGELMMKKMERLAYSDHRKTVTKESMMRIDVTLNLSMPAVVASSVHLDTFLAAGPRNQIMQKKTFYLTLPFLREEFPIILSFISLSRVLVRLLINILDLFWHHSNSFS
jgi:hypothetical protein